MKKYLICMAAALLPLFALAQEPIVSEDIIESAAEMQTVKIYDNLNVVLARKSADEFEVMGFDQNMSIVWKNTFTGYALKLARFNGKVLVIAATDHAFAKGMNNTYKGFLMDPASGKSLLEKVIFQDTDEFMNYPTILVCNNEFKGIAVRQTMAKRKVRVGLPGILVFVTVLKMEKEQRTTQDLDVVQYNETLDPVNSYKPELVKNAVLLGMKVNAWGDIFISWFINGSINVYRYQQGESSPKGIAKSDLQVEESGDGPEVMYATSSTNRNLIYYGVYYIDDASNKAALWVGSLDLSTGQKKQNIEIFDRAHVKEITKAFVPVDKKLDDIEIGSPKNLRLEYLEEHNGLIIAASCNSGTRTSAQGNVIFYQNSVLINGYSTDASLKFQQFLPSEATSYYPLDNGYFIRNNKLHVVGVNGINAKQSAMYGSLDLATGKWDKMLVFPKKKIGNADAPNGPTVLQFANAFALPYFHRTGFLLKLKVDVTLQLNEY